jgi:hypothetical protein
MLNHALLEKWLWCFVHERGAWWRVAVDAKYGRSWGGWCSIEPPRPFGVGLWKNIRRGWGMFSSYTRFKLGDSLKIRF